MAYVFISDLAQAPATPAPTAVAPSVPIDGSSCVLTDGTTAGVYTGGVCVATAPVAAAAAPSAAAPAAPATPVAVAPTVPVNGSTCVMTDGVTAGVYTNGVCVATVPVVPASPPPPASVATPPTTAPAATQIAAANAMDAQATTLNLTADVMDPNHPATGSFRDRAEDLRRRAQGLRDRFGGMPMNTKLLIGAGVAAALLGVCALSQGSNRR